VEQFIPFTIRGEIPDGGPGSETANALRAPIPESALAEVLLAARRVILTATGPRDGMTSSLNVHEFDHAIRAFMPLGHYAAAPNQPISVMDYKMYACRVVSRLLHQATGQTFNLAGTYSSHLAVNARANALYEALLDVAAEHRIPGFVRGWDDRVASGRRPVSTGSFGPQREEQGVALPAARQARPEVRAMIEAARATRARHVRLMAEAANSLASPAAQSLELRADAHPERLKKSTISSPVQAVFAICDAMVARDPAVTRATLIDECTKQGVAFGTASTQISVWRKTRREAGATSATRHSEASPLARTGDDHAARAQDFVAPPSPEDEWTTRRRAVEQRMRAKLEEQLQAELRLIDSTRSVPELAAEPVSPVSVIPLPAWAIKIDNVSARRVFVHLSQHGVIHESELVEILGSPRAARQFGAAFESYLAPVPFCVRIEQLPDGKRYVKEEEK
jgi:hypothetical protein